MFHFPHIHTVHRLYLQYIHMLYFMMENNEGPKISRSCLPFGPDIKLHFYSMIYILLGINIEHIYTQKKSCLVTARES